MSVRISLLFLSFGFFSGVTIFGEEPAKPKAVEPAQPAKKIQKAAAVKKIKVVTVQAAAKLRKAQQEAAKKLAEAQTEAAEAQQALAEAEAAAKQATDPQAKQEAARRVDEAKQKVEQAKKQVEKRQEEARKAAAQAKQIVIQNRRFNFGNVTGVREKVDPQDSKERFLLLAPGGPVIVEADVTLDGKPFRHAREKLIDEMLVAADTDQDGKATWEEAIDNPRFTMGRIRLTNDGQREQFVGGFDTNNNKTVDRPEARRFLAQYFGGPAFALNVGYGGGTVFAARITVVAGGIVARGGGDQADVRKLLDVDDDGVLSEDEIAAAGERLKSQDADDNDLLYPAEIAGRPAPNNGRAVRLFNVNRGPRTQVAVMLGPAATAESVFTALGQRYKSDEEGILPDGFSTTRKLFDQLDKDQSGRVEQDEVLALSELKPHVQLEVRLGQGDGPKGISGEAAITGRAVEKPKQAGQTTEAVSVELPGVNLDFQADLSPPAKYNYDQTAQAYLSRYDNNSNGYLEQKELPAGLARQFELWDADNDGKVYAKEITALYVRQRAPYATQVRATASSDGNALFRALDLSGDGRLGLREMKTAHRQIKTFDKDKDGRVSSEEIPDTISVIFAQGNTRSSRRVVLNRTGVNGNQPAADDLPDWFTRMDRNGDGDVTLREFLGNEEQFKELDTNDDGFIEPKEAIAAEKAKSADSDKRSTPSEKE